MNSHLGGISTVYFLTPFRTGIMTFAAKHILDLVYTTSMTDLYFNLLLPGVSFLCAMKVSGDLGFQGVC